MHRQATGLFARIHARSYVLRLYRYQRVTVEHVLPTRNTHTRTRARIRTRILHSVYMRYMYVRDRRVQMAKWHMNTLMQTHAVARGEFRGCVRTAYV